MSDKKFQNKTVESVVLYKTTKDPTTISFEAFMKYLRDKN